MPYNNSALPPREEPTGTTQLPISRVKKMIALDNDINMCSSNATFVITLAAEMFIQYMAEQGHNVVKSERKPRRNVQYRDLAAAVSRHDNLEFLSDLIPKTVPYSTIKANTSKATKKTTASTTAAANGEDPGATHAHPAAGEQQSILNGVNGFTVRPGSKSGVDLGDLVNGGVPSAGNVGGSGAGGSIQDEDEEDGPDKQLERESKGRRMSVDSADGTVDGGDDGDRMQH